jgi:hypothetical protein
MCGQQIADAKDAMHLSLKNDFLSSLNYDLEVCFGCANSILEAITICQIDTINKKLMVDKDNLQSMNFTKMIFDKDLDQRYDQCFNEFIKGGERHATVHPPKERP